MSASHGTEGDWLHGTSARLSPGEILQPGSMIGTDNHPDLRASGRVHVTRSRIVAEYYASVAADAPFGSRRLHVYKVQPLSPPLADAELGSHWTVDAAVVIEEVDLNPWQP